MLRLEVPNLQELDLDRVIAFGHTWSPTLELSGDEPFFHGHAISVDMALSTTLAQRRGYITESARDRILGLMSRLGLSLDSPLLTPEVLAKGTDSILQTRDGKLRAAVPRPIGTTHFINDLGADELERDARRAPRAGGRLPPRGRGRGHVPPMSAPRSHRPRPRPVTPVGILAATLDRIADGLDGVADVPDDGRAPTCAGRRSSPAGSTRTSSAAPRRSRPRSPGSPR